MKGLILSGGLGSRLRPLTHTSAKQLIPIANKPILFYAIEAMKEAGINDIGIIVGDTKEEIKAAVGDGSKFDVSITYIEQDAPLGLAHAVKISKDFLSDDHFVMYLGDNVLNHGIKGFVEEFENRGNPNALILLCEVPHPEHFGVAEFDKSGNVVNLVEKPKKPKSNFALVGAYIFDKTIFDAVNNIKPSARNELEITDAIQWLIDNGRKVLSHKVSGWWKDTGKPEDILEANKLVLEMIKSDVKGKVDKNSKINGDMVLGKGSEIINSVINGPVAVADNCKINNSHIGPFASINYGSSILGSTIEHSIILEEVEIKNVNKVKDSLIGKGAKIHSSKGGSKAHKFILGDKSHIILNGDQL